MRQKINVVYNKDFYIYNQTFVVCNIGRVVIAKWFEAARNYNFERLRGFKVNKLFENKADAEAEVVADGSVCENGVVIGLDGAEVDAVGDSDVQAAADCAGEIFLGEGCVVDDGNRRRAGRRRAEEIFEFRLADGDSGEGVAEGFEAFCREIVLKLDAAEEIGDRTV